MMSNILTLKRFLCSHKIWCTQSLKWFKVLAQIRIDVTNGSGLPKAADGPITVVLCRGSHVLCIER